MCWNIYDRNLVVEILLFICWKFRRTKYAQIVWVNVSAHSSFATVFAAWKVLSGGRSWSVAMMGLGKPNDNKLTTISTFRALANQNSDGKDGKRLQGAHQTQHRLFIQILSSTYKCCAVQVLFFTMWVFHQMSRTTVLCSQLTVQCKAHWSKCCFKWLRVFSRWAKHVCYTLNNSLMCSVHTEASAVCNRVFSKREELCCSLCSGCSALYTKAVFVSNNEIFQQMWTPVLHCQLTAQWGAHWSKCCS